MGSSSSGDGGEAPEIAEADHLQLLSSIIPRLPYISHHHNHHYIAMVSRLDTWNFNVLFGSHESERISLIRHYSHAFKGFSAMLTENEASVLAAATITLSPNSPLPTATSSSSSSSSSSTAQFLVNSCGLSLQSALSVSKKFQIHENDLHKPRSVVQFMKAHGFSETRLDKLIQSRPGVLHCRVEYNLTPKFEFLTENGVVGQLLPELILSNTHILRRGLDSQIKPCFEFLKSVLGSNENDLVALKHSSWLLTLRLKGTMQPNYNLLIEERVAVDRIAKLIIMDPRAIQNKRDKMISTVSAL
uniref:Inhibitor I9 domain-containing protein n=1 Tax=Populus alba TaxID=43335 RepID=A0A4U5QI33_POPAL|nr:hypothetical protein D5086_0000085380 [Populus alba]